ncbi:uncharacterized protein DFL_006325 [Arthrobotrys flagrans]|uniref:Uncharacterized protein n=1 Tax=Arthrobotrys flagrans TaxID=97331 RepID=A0A437A021_ARTFL|nr:hypothetical protein DFL_006325 [Arthrobotrys flagrans]
MQLIITTLPIELRIKILHHLPSSSSLLSAIISTRSLHAAYCEARTSILTSILQNSTSESSAYCNFLTYALIVFHRKHYITLDRLHKFLRSYLSFANPGCIIGGRGEDVVPWEICPPPDFYNLRTKVHRSIILWATEFCTSKLQESPQIHPMTRNLIPPTPPTPLEIARTARAFYQYFIYTIISTDIFFQSSDVDSMGRPITGKPGIESMGAFIESVGYRDRKVVDWFLKEWMVKIVGKVVRKCVEDEKNPVRRETGVWDVNFLTLEHKVDEATQALITRLGLIQLWKFVFDSTYEEQFKVYCQAPAALDRDSFSPWETLQTERREVECYDPKLRICTGSIEIGGDGVFEWWGEKEGVMKEGILWDERRLERMGLQWPMVREGVEVQWYKKDAKWKDRELATGPSTCIG